MIYLDSVHKLNFHMSVLFEYLKYLMTCPCLVCDQLEFSLRRVTENNSEDPIL